ncbi:MAG: glycosyltransferase family 2 protein [Candidatus Promineifilaceae bacterium]
MKRDGVLRESGIAQQPADPTRTAAQPALRLAVSVVLPVYNEAEVIGRVVGRIAEVLANHVAEFEIIVVDDGSTDDSASEAERAGAEVIRRPYNVGNGAAVKQGIWQASGDVILLMDGDGQHNPEDIPRLLAEILRYDMVVAARNAESVTSRHRTLANLVYNLIASYLIGRPVADLTSGFRVFRADIAKKVAYLFPNGFSYPSTSTIALFRAGYSVKYVPVATAARVGKSKIRLSRDGIGFLLILMRIGVLFAPMRVFLPISLLTFAPGFIYGLYQLGIGRPWTLPVVLSVTAGLIIFALGLISEQIALLRMSRFD